MDAPPAVANGDVRIVDERLVIPSFRVNILRISWAHLQWLRLIYTNFSSILTG